MTRDSIFFLACAFILLILIPLFVRQDLKKGKKKTDIFTSNVMLVISFLISIGE